MEQFPSQYPDSPAVARFSGPQRARLGARRTRTSSLKPYARPQSSLLSASTSAAQSRGEAEEHAPKTATQNDKALPSTPVQARPERTGLLGSLGRALTRPLGWLASGAAKSDLHTSNSTGSLAPLRHGRSRLSVSGEGAGAGGVQDEGEAANAARRIGARLGASVMGSAGDAADDIESHAGNGGMQEPLPRSRTTVDGGWGAPPGHLPPPPSNRHFLATAPSEPALGASTSSFVSPIRRSGRGSHSLLDISGPSAFDAGRRQGSRLSVPSHEPTENERMLSRSPSPALSSASAMVRARGRESLPFGSTAGHGTAYAPSRLRGSSLHPEDVGGMSASQSSPAFAFGFGSERRFAGLGARSPTASPAPATSSAAVQYHLPSRSPLAVRGPRSSLGAGFGGSIAGSASMSDVGALPRPRGGGMYPSYSLAGGSRAGSVMGAWTSASALGRSAKRREWSSLNIAPDLGSQEREDVLMREYAALRPGPMPGSGVGRSGSRAGSVLGGLETMEAPSRQPAVRLGKRDADMSIDWDDRMSSVVSRVPDQTVPGTSIVERDITVQVLFASRLLWVVRLGTLNGSLCPREGCLFFRKELALRSLFPSKLTNSALQSQRSSKRQMVWDPDFGFISREELRARGS